MLTFRVDRAISRVVGVTLLCSVAPGVVSEDRIEPATTPRADRGGQVVVVWSQPAAGERAIRGGVEAEPATRGAGAAPSQAFRDPETGRFVEPAPDQLLDAGPQRLVAALSTSAEGLVEEPVAASPGGVRVNLRRRFRSAVVAERSPGGELSVECDGTEELESREAPSIPGADR